MIKPKKDQSQTSFFLPLEAMLDQKNPLYQLANTIDWEQFEKAFTPLYCEDNGRPAKPIRLMVGLLILKHLRNVSDEVIVEQWAENVYYQHFCGEAVFIPCAPCAATELVVFRKRIGDSGIELILKESIRINGKDSNDPNASADTTVQEKNITYPTDNKLHRKIIERCKKISEKEDLPVRQSYTQTLKKLGVNQRFRNHPKNKSKVRKADKKVKTIAGRLVREIERNLPPNSKHQIDLELFKKILSQQRADKNKVYSLHEPEVLCISKGKEHKKYEFGNKASIILTQKTGVIISALSFRNPYDGHTLESALEQTDRLLEKNNLETITTDRGYRGVTKIQGITVLTPKPFNDKKQNKYQQQKLRKQFQKRAGIEPIIGHLKTDHRLGRNFYKGIIGDNINVMLSAAAFNFKRMMNKWKKIFLIFLETIFFKILMINIFNQKSKLAFSGSTNYKR